VDVGYFNQKRIRQLVERSILDSSIVLRIAHDNVLYHTLKEDEEKARQVRLKSSDTPSYSTTGGNGCYGSRSTTVDPQREIIHEDGGHPKGNPVIRVPGDELEDGGDTKSASVQKPTPMQNGTAQLPGGPRVFRVFLSSPGESEITDAVKGPARRAIGLLFEPDERDNRTLPRALVDDTPSANALPLLQMTLLRLFEARADMMLTWQAYQAMGGVPGAITAHAEKVFAALSTSARLELQPLVAALVREVVRRAPEEFRFTMMTTETAWESTPARRELAAAFVEARLLIRDEPEPGHIVLRAAHEAVLRQWAPAREALGWIVDKELRRARLLRAGAVMAAAVFLLLTIAAGYQWRTASTERDKARTQLLAIQARRTDTEAASPNQIELAGALALESIQLAHQSNQPIQADAIETAGSLLNRLPMAVPAHRPVDSLVVLADGRLASGSVDGTIKPWPKDLKGDPVVLQQGSNVRSLVVLADGRLASSGNDGIKLWLVDEQKLIAALCLRAGRNLTKDEWDRYIGSDTPWQSSCRGFPSNWRTPELKSTNTKESAL
jgi:hypothetical protein